MYYILDIFLEHGYGGASHYSHNQGDDDTATIVGSLTQGFDSQSSHQNGHGFDVASIIASDVGSNSQQQYASHQPYSGEQSYSQNYAQPSYSSHDGSQQSYDSAPSYDSYASGHSNYNSISSHSNHQQDSYVGVDSYKPPPSGK